MIIPSRLITCPKCETSDVMPVRQDPGSIAFLCLKCGTTFAVDISIPGTRVIVIPVPVMPAPVTGAPGHDDHAVGWEQRVEEPGWLKGNSSWQRLVSLFLACGLDHPYTIIEATGNLDFTIAYSAVPETCHEKFTDGMKAFTIEEIAGFLKLRPGMT